MSNYKEERPWGTFENLLDVDYCKVKEIVIKPGQAPSYQYHHNRSETWTITKGTGEATLDGETESLSPGSVVIILAEVKHRIVNTGDEDLVFIEVQTGTYFGEDDIVRIEDNYGRI
jgi:mannose-6-phosphate isomerase-like protein (cupin superfamily)